VRALSLIVPALGLALLPGCHAKFKKNAGTLGEVRVQTVLSGAPYVNLGKIYADSDDPALLQVAAAVVNTVQVVNEIDQTARIANAVHISEVNRALEAGLAQTLGSGPPFAFSDSQDAPALLQIQVESYGLNVPWMGAPGEFTYSLHMRIYKADGERVYNAWHTCEAGAGTPSAPEVVLSVVNNVRSLNEMSDADIHAAFETIAFWCGQEVVLKMRRHAS
jgi:hypothetical protein